MFKVINGGMMPTRGTEFSACVDLYANADIVIGAGETAVIPLGVCVDFSNLSTDEHWREAFGRKEVFFKKSHYLQLELRSSLRAKGLQAGTGIIDLDYKDEICLILSNPYTNKKQRVEVTNEYGQGIGCRFIESAGYKILKGDRIAQIMLCEHKSYLFGIESQDVRNGGMGSTDK